MRRNRSTRSGGIKPPDHRRRRRGRGTEVRRTLRALSRLARARRRIEHVPTLMQVRAMAHTGHGPTVEEVVRFEDLPIGSTASRRAVVRWSDGTEGAAIRFYGDEVLSPVDHVGRH